ncbi:MAG: ABC transporter ATP-binding protein, partial [Candidatus Omnitrophota bacterium]
MSIIKLQDIWEKFRIKFIREGVVTWKEFYALERINFEINAPGVLGIIGHNGAGKTTLLKIIAGMLMPDKGVINVNGRISMLMELGAGFNPEFTGRENIILNARMYGVDESNLNQQIGKIVEFADLGEFIDAPIKYYSQGMHMRLAFALAIFVEPDILLIDDILAVGDEEARQKCIKKIFELKGLGKTILLVSHDMDMVSKLCDRVILLDKGKIIKDGSPESVVQYYMDMVGDKKGIAILSEGDLKVVFNNGRVNILWKDKIITRQQGGYLAYFSNKINNWLLSFNFSWQINELSSNSIIAQAKDVNNDCSQVWRIRLEAQELIWNVEINEPKTKDEHIDLFFIVDYKNWQTLGNKEAFPPFIYKSNWQDLKIDNSLSEGLIAFRPENDSTDLSGIIFEVEKEKGSFKVFNTGYDQEGRVIQVYFNEPRNICFRLKLFSEESSFKGYLEPKIKQFLIEKNKQLLLEQRIREEEQRFQEEQRFKEEQRLKDEQKLKEEQRFRKEQALLEQRLREEEQRLREEQRLKEERRLKEEQRIREQEQRFEEEQRLKEEQRL